LLNVFFLRFCPNEHEKGYSIFVRCHFSGIRPILQHSANASCFKFRPHTWKVIWQRYDFIARSLIYILLCSLTSLFYLLNTLYKNVNILFSFHYDYFLSCTCVSWPYFTDHLIFTNLFIPPVPQMLCFLDVYYLFSYVFAVQIPLSIIHNHKSLMLFLTTLFLI
jgi:hypothetical protein